MATGAVEAYLDYGTDLALQANGDLLLAVDNANLTTATVQRIMRLLNTNPALYNDAGIYISAPEDVFNPTYGAGLPAEIGQMITPAFTADIQARIVNALNYDPSIAAHPDPVVTVTQPNISTILVSIQCTAVNGAPLAINLQL
jgi:hypothetical protein